MSDSHFAEIKIEGWRQFSNVHIKFHPRLTIITGSNGAGKSTILRILAQHFGWPALQLGTPTISRSGALSYLSGLFSWRKFDPQAPVEATIGTIVYSDGRAAQLAVPTAGGIQYNVNIRDMNTVVGMNISSHRPIPSYQQIANIPTSAIDAAQAFDSYRSEAISRYNNGYTSFSPTYRMKEALISMATFGPGNQYVQPNARLEALLEGFKEVLRKLLPEAIGFLDISVRLPDVVLVTESGDFVIDAASGGLMSLIDIAWQIFLFGSDKSSFAVVVDEPENHLHPSMQRSVLSSLLGAFPNVQFIVATHSPFVVSSVKDSAVYVLRYSPTVSEGHSARRVSSIELDTANKAGTASEILRDVLGVPVTLPDWAEKELRIIASEFTIDQLTTENIFLLRKRLDDQGLGEYYPDTVKQIAGQK